MLISVKSLIKESWKLYKNNLVLFSKVILWLLIPAVISSLLPYLGLHPLIFAPLNIIISIVSALIGIFISAVLILIIVGLYKKEEINLKNIYNLGYSKLASCVWISLLSFFVALAAMFVSALPALLGLLLSKWLPAKNAILTICYSLSGTLLVISSIALAVWLSFSFYVVVLENIKGKAALWRSKLMVTGKFWPVLWRWVAPYFIFMIILLVVVLIPTYIIGFIVGSPGAGFTETPPWWSVLISNVIYTFAVPLFAIAGVLLYNSLKQEQKQPTR